MADAILKQVITSWEPRIVNNGVDMNDYHWTVDGLEKWDQWYGAWMALGRKHEDLAQEAETQGRAVTAGEAYYRAAIAYHFAVFCWVDDLDEYTAGHRKRVECYGKALGTLDPPGERVEFPLEGITLPAYLRKPRGVSRPPVVLFLSGLDSAKEEHATFESFFLRLFYTHWFTINANSQKSLPLNFYDYSSMLTLFGAHYWRNNSDS